jgi:hypothetical protein
MRACAALVRCVAARTWRRGETAPLAARPVRPDRRRHEHVEVRRPTEELAAHADRAGRRARRVRDGKLAPIPFQVDERRPADRDGRRRRSRRRREARTCSIRTTCSCSSRATPATRTPRRSARARVPGLDLARGPSSTIRSTARAASPTSSSPSTPPATTGATSTYDAGRDLVTRRRIASGWCRRCRTTSRSR